MSLPAARRFASGVFSKPAFTSTHLVRSSIPQRLSSNNAPKSSRPSSSAPHNDRSQFKILPILVIIAIGSGSYVFLVKSRTGQSPQRPSN
ncbi:uncharacterized protein N7473_010855 [Penicillium subrubescens]|uniref:Uncharacterized protein n=1 Tax=Penicillium subrubescens TaxID=1316194 RepID=A0A1Q5T2F4_9EURO|nr:uncharacterized protein N7473_010855 [Penicillium subrubescens]KAJ5883969.1 hypothetical protein N7473_010855 [Penicillium subrubescens]OKO94421.1 hypothetical protein PENSUB_11688 [Penicillium subrubescens]